MYAVMQNRGVSSSSVEAYLCRQSSPDSWRHLGRARNLAFTDFRGGCGFLLLLFLWAFAGYFAM